MSLVFVCTCTKWVVCVISVVCASVGREPLLYAIVGHPNTAKIAIYAL